MLIILNASVKIIWQRGKPICRYAEKNSGATLSNHKAGGRGVQQQYRRVHAIPFDVTMFEDVAVGDHCLEGLLDDAAEGFQVIYKLT